MLALATLLPLAATAAEEGKKVIYGMLIVGLIFLAVILIGDGLHYLQLRRERARASRPL
jgi:hypothetical protein